MDVMSIEDGRSSDPEINVSIPGYCDAQIKKTLDDFYLIQIVILILLYILNLN